MESDEDFAARMRARRGQPLPRRKPSWRQLLDLTIENVHEMIMNPGVIDDDGNIAEEIGVDVLSVGDAGNSFTGEFAVQTMLADGSYGTVERRVRRVNVAPIGSGMCWLLAGEQPNEWATVELKTNVYEQTVNRIRDVPWQTAFSEWANVIEAGLLTQHTNPAWRLLDRRTIGWRVAKSEVEDEMRASFTLEKHPDVWIDHDGKLATPWGSINCARDAPVIVEGSKLDYSIRHAENTHAPLTVSEDVWIKGLRMPSYDLDRVRRILAAQMVIVEVPLVA